MRLPVPIPGDASSRCFIQVMRAPGSSQCRASVQPRQRAVSFARGPGNMGQARHSSPRWTSHFDVGGKAFFLHVEAPDVRGYPQGVWRPGKRGKLRPAAHMSRRIRDNANRTDDGQDGVRTPRQRSRGGPGGSLLRALGSKQRCPNRQDLPLAPEQGSGRRAAGDLHFAGAGSNPKHLRPGVWGHGLALRPGSMCEPPPAGTCHIPPAPSETPTTPRRKMAWAQATTGRMERCSGETCSGAAGALPGHGGDGGLPSRHAPTGTEGLRLECQGVLVARVKFVVDDWWAVPGGSSCPLEGWLRAWVALS